MGNGRALGTRLTAENAEHAEKTLLLPSPSLTRVSSKGQVLISIDAGHM